MSKIRIAVVDDHEVVRHGLHLSLELEADMVVAGEARTGEEAIHLARDIKPDVMLLDVRLEGKDGPEVCRRVLEVAPRTAVIMLTNYLQDGLVFRSLMAGAKGYVIKDVQLSELKKMIRSVYRGGAVLDPKVTGQVISTATASGEAPVSKAAGPRNVTVLSETDLAIVKHLSTGLTNKQIAGQVHLSPHTIKDHLEKVRMVLGVGSRTEIVAEALYAVYDRDQTVRTFASRNGAALDQLLARLAAAAEADDQARIQDHGEHGAARPTDPPAGAVSAVVDLGYTGAYREPTDVEARSVVEVQTSHGPL